MSCPATIAFGKIAFGKTRLASGYGLRNTSATTLAVQSVELNPSSKFPVSQPDGSIFAASSDRQPVWTASRWGVYCLPTP